MSLNNNVPDWVFTIFCPLLGVIITNIMFLSPFPTVFNAIKVKELGNLNPLPWIPIVLNCFGWSLYACMKRDHFVFWSNFPGLLSGVFFVVTAIKLLYISNKESDLKNLKIVENLFFFAFLFWGIIAMLSAMAFGKSEQQRESAAFFVGIVSCLMAVVYYIAPLSNMVKIIKTRNSSSLYPPTLFANLSCTMLWVIYGFAIGDPVIWSPNAISLVFAVAQIILYVAFTPLRVNVRKVTLLKALSSGDVVPNGDTDVHNPIDQPLNHL